MGKICFIEKDSDKRKCDENDFFPSTSKYGVGSLFGKKSDANSRQEAKRKYTELVRLGKIDNHGEDVYVEEVDGEYHIRPPLSREQLITQISDIRTENTKMVSNLLFLTINLVHKVIADAVNNGNDNDDDDADELGSRQLLDKVVPGGSLTEYETSENFRDYFVKCVKNLKKYLSDLGEVSTQKIRITDELNNISNYFKTLEALNMFEKYNNDNITPWYNEEGAPNNVESDILLKYINEMVGEDLNTYYDEHEEKIVTLTFEFFQKLLNSAKRNNLDGGNSRHRKTKRRVTRKSKKRRMNKKKSSKKKRKTRKHVKLQ